MILFSSLVSRYHLLLFHLLILVPSPLGHILFIIICLDFVDLHIQILRLGTKWSHPLRTKSIWASSLICSSSPVPDPSFWLTGSSSCSWASRVCLAYFTFGLVMIKTHVMCICLSYCDDFVYESFMLAYEYTTLCVVLWSLLVLLCLAYIRGGFFWPTYIRCSDVPVSVESGRYRLVSEPRLSNLKYNCGKF